MISSWQYESEGPPSDTWMISSLLKNRADDGQADVSGNVSVCLCRSGNKTELFSDLSAFPVLQERRDQIQTVLSEIQDHRREVRVTLRAPTLEYTTVSGQEVVSECLCVPPTPVMS